MNEAIVVALITGGLSLVGVVVTCLTTSRRSEKKQEIVMAVMQTEISELTREGKAGSWYHSFGCISRR